MFFKHFSAFAQHASHALGSAWAFSISIGCISLWTVGGCIFGFGDTYQLAMNSVVNLVTFLFVVLIQHTQIRESDALQTKLNELVRATREAQNRVIGLEEQPLDQIERTHAEVTREAGKEE
jgi:low affinity Fe/Cu permease